MNEVISIRQGQEIIIAYLGSDDNLRIKVCRDNGKDVAYTHIHDDLPLVMVTPNKWTYLDNIVSTLMGILHLEYEQEDMIASIIPDGWMRYDPPIIGMGDISKGIVREPCFIMGEALLTRRMIFSEYRNEGRPLINVSLTITFGGDERFPLVSASTTVGNEGELNTFLLDNLPLKSIGVDGSYGVYFPDDGGPHNIYEVSVGSWDSPQ